MPNTREKLIELLEPYANDLACEQQSGSCELTSCRSCNARNLADHLIANGVTVQEWMPVTEKLPEPGVRVLATDGGFVGEFYINKRGQWQRYNVNDSNLLMALDVLWWMPLPQPPKEDL